MIRSYDAALFDLDGVIYLGPTVIPGAAVAVRGLRTDGVKVGFVTNNAARSPVAVAEHLTELGVDATADDVVTSAQAGARMLAERLPSGSPVFIMGTESLAAEVALVGLRPVSDLKEQPRAVIQGFNPELTWQLLETACEAIHGGALWLATNTDGTRPTDRGIMPGNGSMVDAVRNAVGREPLVAGKPFRPLIDEAISRTGAERPVFIGDRLDTDIEGAVTVGIDSAMVLTGAHGVTDLLAAPSRMRPTHLLADLSELTDPVREVEPLGDGARCRDATVRLVENRLVWTGPTDTAAQRTDLAWAAAHTGWIATDRGDVVEYGSIPEVR